MGNNKAIQAIHKHIRASKENLQTMLQEMKRRGCKGIGGIHWDEMTIKEGIVLCKRTGELVGFEDDVISNNLHINIEDLCDNIDDVITADDNDDGSCDESSTGNSSDLDSSADSEGSDAASYTQSIQSKKSKLICQFFFSSIEGDFTWPVASFPLHRINHKVLSSMVWKVCESLGSLYIDENNKIQVIYGVSDGSTYSHAFFCRAGAQNWVIFNPFNDNKPIWWLSDYPHMIKKLRKFIVNPKNLFRTPHWSG